MGLLTQQHGLCSLLVFQKAQAYQGSSRQDSADKDK